MQCSKRESTERNQKETEWILASDSQPFQGLNSMNTIYFVIAIAIITCALEESQRILKWASLCLSEMQMDKIREFNITFAEASA